MESVGETVWETVEQGLKISHSSTDLTNGFSEIYRPARVVESVGETVWETVEQGLKISHSSTDLTNGFSEIYRPARVVESVDTRDLKSLAF